jgi:hypothetical protein
MFSASSAKSAGDIQKFAEKSAISPLNSHPMNDFFSGKKRLIPLALLAFVALLAVLLFVRSSPSPYHALPSQAAVVLEFNSLLKFNQLKKKLPDAAWREVLETTVFKNLWRDVAAAEKLFGHDPALRDAFARQKMLAALTLNRADSLHGLFVLDAGAELNIRKLLASNAVAQKIFPSVFHDHTLYTVHLNKQERLVVTTFGDLLLFSRFSYLVEDAITQLEGSSSWWADRRWMQDLDADAPLRLFFRPEAMAAQYENSMAAGWNDLPALLKRNVEWLGFAWDGRSVTALAEPKGFFGNMGDWGKAAEGDIFSVLPDNTALLAKASFANSRRFFEKIKTTESPDFEQFVLPWAGGEAAWVVTEPFSRGMRDDQFIVLAARDSADALAHLRNYARQRGARRVEDYQTFEVFDFLSQSLLKPLLGEGPIFRNPSCAMLGRYVVFANTRSALELWIDKYIVSQTLAQDTDFLQWKQKNPVPANAQLLLNAAYLPLLLKDLFDARRESFNPDDVQAFANAGFVGANFQPAGNGRLEMQLAAQSQVAAKTQASILWKTPLAGLAATQPFVVAPFSEEGSAAILIQDAHNELYRLDAGGAAKWRRPMEGPILGRVQGIDFWANGTAFFFFNTANHIWILDDEGRDVQGFPLQMQSPATNGVTVVDFDKNLKYNYFVACANGNLYGFDQFGRSLPGWNPQGGTGRVRHPVLHFQHGNKDYLAALNEAGKLFVFARDGTGRFPPVQFSGKNFGPPQADAGAKTPRIVCANEAGAVFVCSLDGNTFNMQMGKGGNTPARLVFAPLSGDGRHDFALLKEKNLRASGYEGGAMRTIFQTQLPVPQDTLFAVGANRLGTLSRSKRQILLLDAAGKIHPDFPVAGTTPFALSDFLQKNGGQVLVVGAGSSVYAYKIR